MKLSELLNLFCAASIDVDRISREISQLPQEQWSEELSITSWTGMSFLHAIMISVVNLSQKDIQQKLLSVITKLAPGEAWEIEARERNAKIKSCLKKSPISLLTARSCLLFLWNSENNPALLPLIMTVLKRVPSEKWHGEIESYIHAATHLLFNRPHELYITEFFEFLCNTNNANPDFWVNPTLIHKDSVPQEKAKKQTQVLPIAPLSALINILRIKLNNIATEEDTLICKSLIRSLGKLSANSRDTDWEPLLTEESSDSPLNELMELIASQPNNAVLHYIAKQVLDKASQEAIEAISDNHRKNLDLFPDLVETINKRMPVMKKQAPVVITKTKAQTDAAQNAALPAAAAQLSQPVSLINESKINAHADDETVKSEKNKNDSPADARVRTIRRWTHNPYLLLPTPNVVKKNIQRSALAIAFDPQGFYS